MKIAILGGGITGLTVAYDLAKKGYDVELFEKEAVLGGLAVGFRKPYWQWPLERAYHHLFSNDSDIINFASEIGFDKIFFKEPHTDSLYVKNGEINIIPVDTPLDFLRFPYLSPASKIRASAILAALKIAPPSTLFERFTAEQFVKKYMGNQMWNVFFQELFRKKFGKYAGNILAAFIWARINKRTKSLGYIRGGFQTFIDYLGAVDKKLGVKIRVGEGVESLNKNNDQFIVNGAVFDVVISTLPTPLLSKIAGSVLPQIFLSRFNKLNYLHASVLIVESEAPLLKESYWLNVCAREFPFMVLVQHTNFAESKYYGGRHILYIGNYVERTDPLLKMTKEEVFKKFAPFLKKINPGFNLKTVNLDLFVGPFAQPIFDQDFLKNKPDFITPVKNFYIANLDMTYPYDRGTNYAVKLGREAAQLI